MVVFRRNSGAYYTYERDSAGPKKSARGFAGASAGPCAAIRRLYESRDSRLCVFEDSRGHVVAVRASRLV